MSVETGNGEMQKTFDHFPEMPNEIKLMMVKEMELHDRYRFARCSRSSLDFWAKITRNETCFLSVFIGKQSIRIEVQHGEYRVFGRGKDGFRLDFYKIEIDGSKLIRYTKLPYTELWNNKVDKSIDIIQLGVHYIEKRLEFYQNGIKELHINGSCTEETLMNLDSIESFKNLEVLHVSDCAEILNSLLSKLRSPLKKLDTSWMINRTNHKNCDQLFQVQDELKWFPTDFNYQEFLRLSATKVHINIGKLTEQNIFNFIKFWENGTYNGRIERCTWYLGDSTFNNHLLCQLFQIDYSESSINTLDFVQKGSGKIATLKVGVFELQFTINSS